MSLWEHCQVNLSPKYRYWAECRLGSVSIHTAKLSRDLLGMRKFCSLAVLLTWMLQHLGMRNTKIHSNMGVLYLKLLGVLEGEVTAVETKSEVLKNANLMILFNAFHSTKGDFFFLSKSLRYFGKQGKRERVSVAHMHGKTSGKFLL